MITLLLCTLLVIFIRFQSWHVFLNWVETLVTTLPKSLTLSNLLTIALLYICSTSGIAGIVLALIWRAVILNYND